MLTKKDVDSKILFRKAYEPCSIIRCGTVTEFSVTDKYVHIGEDWYVNEEVVILDTVKEDTSLPRPK